MISKDKSKTFLGFLKRLFRAIFNANEFRNIPDNMSSKRARVGYIFFRMMYTFERGKASVFGRLFSDWFTELGIFYLVLTQMGFRPTKLIIIFSIIGFIITCYYVGKVYMHLNLDRIDSQVHSERNPIDYEVYRATVKEKEMLK